VVVWVGGTTAFVAAVCVGRISSPGRETAAVPPSWQADAFAAVVGLGLGAMSLFITRPNSDDAFYVNRAGATADLNRIPVRDVLFTDEVVGPTGAAGLPVDSFSALQGALARAVGVEGASIAYYVVPPALTFLAAWALWRLLRSWAPRNVVLCFALGSLYWLLSAQSGLMAGSIFLTRMWQGKVVLAAWLVPTLYTYLTRWLTRRDALTGVLLLAGGLSSIGMTGSAAHLVPLLFATGAVVLLGRRDWRGLPVVMVAAAIPLLVGLVAVRKYPLPTQVGGSFETSWYFQAVFGTGVLAALAWIAVWVAPWLTRAGPATSLTTAIAGVSTFLLAPSLLPLVADITGVAANLRRMLWIVPLPALVGLLAAFPAASLLRRSVDLRPPLRQVAVGASALLVAALLVAFGHPLWRSVSGESLWVARPAWKVSPRPLADAYTILGRYSGSGPILASEQTMRAIAVVTVEPRTVNPHSWYVRLTPEPRTRIQDRLLLTRFVDGLEPIPTRQEVARALARLRVDLVCVRGPRERVAREIRPLWAFREAFDVAGLVCLVRERESA
jgi:hypothetical protein